MTHGAGITFISGVDEEIAENPFRTKKCFRRRVHQMVSARASSTAMHLRKSICSQSLSARKMPLLRSQSVNNQQKQFTMKRKRMPRNQLARLEFVTTNFSTSIVQSNTPNYQTHVF